MTSEKAKKILTVDYTTNEEKAFKTIIKNRIFHGGILAKGAGLINFGENGKGIKSRWYPQTLAKRIKHIARIKNKITFIQDNGIEIIKNYLNNNNVFFFDPPYTIGGKKAGSRLYNYHKLDHELLFSLCNNIDNFLMTYDVSDEIEILARRHNYQIEKIPMKNTHNTAMKEFIISKNLKWV
jgi:DNA adenine methylase